MKYVNEFRDPAAAKGLAGKLASHGAALGERQVNVMEVCGSHTMAIARYGIRDLLPANVRLISGPGCPVCVTDAGYLDVAVELARRGVIVASFGDLINVPGSETTLVQARSEGGRIEVCYSPRRAVELAMENPGSEVVFLGIGFETTIAPVISLLEIARRESIGNLSLLTAFKLVPPAMAALLADPEVRIDAFLCPAHVSAVIGSAAYQPFAGHGVPCVVAGFEPLDILLGMDELLRQLIVGEALVKNQYSRVVREHGNPKSLRLMNKYLNPVDAHWRGIGTIPASGLELRAEFAEFNAEKRFDLPVRPGNPDPRCRCGDVLKGIILPSECLLFGNVCRPDHPVGPCMVSSEGSCSAFYKYGRQ